MLGVELEDGRLAGHEGREGGVREVAQDERARGPEERPPERGADARDRVGRGRLDEPAAVGDGRAGPVEGRVAAVLGRGHGREDAERDAADAARDLGRAEDGRLLRRVRVDDALLARAVVDVAGDEALALRAAPDAARVEQVGAVVGEVAARAAEREHVRALDEERAALVEEELEAAEVDLRGVGLDLPEVRVDGRGERQVGGEAELQVEPDARGQVGRGVVGVGRAAGRARVGGARGLGRDVGDELEAARRAQADEAGEVAEVADEAVERGALRGPEDLLARALDPAAELDAPGLPRRPRRCSGAG